MTLQLKRLVQCEKCPWLVTTDANTIPNGYSIEKHKDLKTTISDQKYDPDFQKKPLHIMACHKSRAGQDTPCIGWLNNQLKDGNNIALRVYAMGCPLVKHIRLIGEQHKSFEDTIPQ